MSLPTHNEHDVESGRSNPEDVTKTTGIQASVQMAPKAADASQPPVLKRGIKRTSTSRTLGITPQRRTWLVPPPGSDPSKVTGDTAVPESPHEEGHITVMDFNEGDLVMHTFDQLEYIELTMEYLQRRESWIKCRWVSVTGVNWNVIKALGQWKGLHRLAVEDMLNDSRLAKTEWYADHVYIGLALQKLVHLDQIIDESDSESGNDESIVQGLEGAKRRGLFSRNEVGNRLDEYKRSSKKRRPDLPTPQTLQEYNGYSDKERIAYMETHSALASKKLVVITDRVSIFLMADNTVISFAHSSAEDIESIVCRQLVTFNTLFRESCDASVITQGILTAIIDLAIPVTDAYRDSIGKLELDVLTQPTLKHTSSLYIITSEIEWIRSSISPILNIVRALRDHENITATSTTPIRDKIDGVGQSRVTISSAAQTYIRDAEGRIILITESLDAMKTSCTNMIDLIFNTISAYQNESIKQLTIVTIIFLPMSFLAAYFAVPFKDFSTGSHNQGLYWGITIPIAVFVILFLMRDMMRWYFTRCKQRRTISRRRAAARRRESGYRRD